LCRRVQLAIAKIPATIPLERIIFVAHVAISEPAFWRFSIEDAGTDHMGT
jgi:hypothetical protein